MISISNLRYADAAETLIDMTVSDGDRSIPFTYLPSDKAPLSKVVRSLLEQGEYEIAPYEPPPDEEE